MRITRKSFGPFRRGASLLVEAVRRFTDVEADQTRLSLTIVGFATAFELVVLAWSSARREPPTLSSPLWWAATRTTRP